MANRELMHGRFAAALLSFGLSFTLFPGYGFGEKVRTAIPQGTLNYLSVYVAEAKGFFRDEGLDNET
ncbi:MAG: hypothetical protein AAB279_02030, partial [Candidatus Binatota bacterium]